MYEDLEKWLCAGALPRAQCTKVISGNHSEFCLSPWLCHQFNSRAMFKFILLSVRMVAESYIVPQWKQHVRYIHYQRKHEHKQQQHKSQLLTRLILIPKAWNVDGKSNPSLFSGLIWGAVSTKVSNFLPRTWLTDAQALRRGLALMYKWKWSLMCICMSAWQCLSFEHPYLHSLRILVAP